MHRPVTILVDPQNHPAVLEFFHDSAPTFRALMIFDNTDDAFRWLSEQSQPALWAGYAPAMVPDLAQVERVFRDRYKQGMSIIDISQIMRAANSMRKVQ